MSDAQNTLERRRRVHLSPRLCTVVSYLTDLSVELGGAVFKNPVMPASGTYDYFENNADCFPVSELGAVMIKSVHRLRRPGNPGPRIAEVCGGMLNCVGIPSVGIEAFLRDELPRYENIGTQVILSISGSEPVHYAEIAELVGDDPRIAALEMNLSCPNVGSGLPFSSDPQLLYDTVRQTRQRTTLPLYAKLSPNVTDIRVSCRAAEDAGADALTLSNTFRAMTIDIQKRRPYLGNLSGGMSGPAVKPMNMFLVWQAYETVHIPIIACGGIASWRDAVEYLMAGASAVQVGSGLPFSSDPQLLYDTVRQTRQRTTLPLYAKLSPNVTDIRVSCRAAEDAGADALTLSNTFRAMTIDIQKRRPYLGNLSGGMSGPAVKPMNMFLVWQAYETVHIPIIACGGIASWRDAVEYLMAGASAVQVGSCNFNDPMTMHNIIHDLDSYLHRNGIASVRELCGAAHKQ